MSDVEFYILLIALSISNMEVWLICLTLYCQVEISICGVKLVKSITTP